MGKIFDIAKDSEQSWGTIATAIDDNLDAINDVIINGEIIVVDTISSADLINEQAYWALNVSVGATLPETPQSIDGYCGYRIEVQKGDIITITSTNNTNITPWAIANAQRIVTQISDIKGTLSLETYNIIVEQEGWLYTNQNAATKESFSIIVKQKESKGLKEQVADNAAKINTIQEDVSIIKTDIQDLKLNFKNYGYMSIYDIELSAGKQVALEYNNVRKNYSLSAYIKITDFGSLKIGKGLETDSGFNIIIDSVNITVNGFRSVSDGTTFAHGLNIETFVGFEIKNVGGTSSFSIYSDNGRFDLGQTCTNPGYDSAFIESIGTTGVIRSFHQVNVDYKKEIWLIQDSYGTWASWGWGRQIFNMGFDSFLIDSKGGANSSYQLNILKTHLKYGTPKYLVWGMGMNDRDTDTAYNSNWKTALDEVISICEQKKIQLILCTIPNVPDYTTYFNTYKNRYIKTLEYPIIDLADAVQLSFEGYEWKPGLLQEDQVHPNENGAKVLSIRAICDFPQFVYAPII